MVKKVITGGQTGVERMALEVAKELGIQTGGSVPKGFRTENGSDPTLKEFGLQETQSEGYTFRTLHNVLESESTVIFGDLRSPNSQQAVANLITNKKPYITNPTVEQLVAFLRTNNVQVLNVTGNRGSRLTVNQYKLHEMVLMQALKEVNAVPVTNN